MMCSGKSLSLWILITLFALGNRACPAQEELAEVLKARLTQCIRFAWSFEGRELNRAPIDWTRLSADESDPLRKVHQEGLAAFKPKEGKSWQGKAVLDTGDGRFKYDFVMQGQRYGSYFDGKFHATNSPTKTKEGDGPAMLEIGVKPQVANVFELGLFSVGFHYLPCRVVQVCECFGTSEESIPLEDLIELIQDDAIDKKVEQKEGQYVVRFPAFVRDQDGVHSGGEVAYTFGMDGALEAVAWKGGELWSPTCTVRFANQASVKGTRVPSEVEYVDWMAGYARRLRFDEWRQSQDHDFAFDIPEGAMVTDHVNQLAYKNSGSAVQESRSAQLYALQHGLKLPNPQSRWGYMRILSILGLITLGLVGIIRKWKYGSFLVLPVAVSVIAGCGNRSSDAGYQNTPPVEKVGVWQNGVGWKLRPFGNSEVYISQCGMTATLLALEIAERKHNPLVVARHLKPTLQGITMSDIKTVLEAHGVSVHARKELTMRSVVDISKEFDFALVHLPQYQRGAYIDPHYIVVLRDHAGRTLLLDPPLAPAVVARSDPAISKLTGLTALLCKRRSEIHADWQFVTPDIRIAPERFVDGVLVDDVVIRNTGGGPLAIVEAQVSCPCVELEFSPIIIPPDQTHVFRVRIDKMKWAAGQQNVVFRDALGNARKVVVKGASSEEVVQGKPLATGHAPFVISRSLSVPRNCGKAGHALDFVVPISEFVPEGAIAVSDSDGSSRVMLRHDGIQAAVEGRLSLSGEDVVFVSNGELVQHRLRIVHGDLQVGTLKLNIHRESDLEHSLSSEGDFSVRLRDADGWTLEEVTIDGVEIEEKNTLAPGQWRMSVPRSSISEGRHYLVKAKFCHPEHPCFSRTTLVTRSSNVSSEQHQ
jgi:hypothetical protein